MVSAVAVAVWEFSSRYGDQFRVTVATVVGLFLIGIGLPVVLVAVGTLRGSYSSTLVIREDHRLVRHGIYGLVRHPVYCGTILVLTGLPLCLSSVYGTAIMLLVIPLFLNRIRIEERLLIEEFGAEYEAYMEATEKLMPLIY
jgi:protein-S-isoprenylcysteine O-methyltransferase Ste14